MRTIISLLLTIGCSICLYAQESETRNIQVDMTSESSRGDWYNSPWIWVIIAAIIIIVLVAMTKGWKRKE